MQFLHLAIYVNNFYFVEIWHFFRNKFYSINWQLTVIIKINLCLTLLWFHLKRLIKIVQSYETQITWNYGAIWREISNQDHLGNNHGGSWARVGVT